MNIKSIPHEPQFIRRFLPGMTTLMIGLSALTLVACQAVSTPTTNAGPSPQSTSTLSPQEESVLTPTPSLPAGVPTEWKPWRNARLNLSLHYPETWHLTGEAAARGTDGFWQVESRPYAPSLYDQLSHLCVQEANQPSRNARYGETPFIHDWQSWDAERNAWLGYGCIVSPESPQPGLESVLFARDPFRPADLLVLRADSSHFRYILSSLRFLQVPPEPTRVEYYDSPSCREEPEAPAVSSRKINDLLITEYAVAKETCCPLQHFDGFRARLNALNVNTSTLWKQSQRMVMQAANDRLAPFGLHLEESQTAKPWPLFDLKKGNEILVSNLSFLGEVSTRPDGKDFLFWGRAEDSNGSQYPVLVTTKGVQTFPFGEEVFHSVWAGDRLISFQYSKTEIFPIGAPASIDIFANGQRLQTLSIPQMGAAGSPVRGLWNWDGHWVMEIRSTLFVDGIPKNEEWGYAEIFDWHLVNGKPFFGARRLNDFVLVYDGQELPLLYDDIAHGDVCCAMGIYDFQPLADGALFYARRDGVWFLVRVQVVEE